MNKIEIQLPAVVNNVVITERILSTIDGFQTGGYSWLPHAEKKFDDAELAEKLADCKQLMHYFVGIIQRGTSEDENATENDLIGRVYWLHSLFEEFKTPPELFEPEK